MVKKMLIDAAHPEETRVVVLDGQRVDDFDFEALNKKQLRGNIYLAKVTRVEPSLQAAFVEYGGNRHGFLAFGEIHPDYYQIPVADREALKAEVEAAQGRIADAEDGENGQPEGEEDAADEERRRTLLRRYRIQEVIKRRQIMLVQVTKEERGNKGAALTTYLSLAGRYCVLMPNTPRGGGISRKITSAPDRKRLKKVASELEVPNGMGLIIRTAGAKRTKTEIKRDYEYLLRAWENIRDLTLRSVAPACIYEESSLVKRAIRDLYDKDVGEIYVEGDGAYREAKDFVRMLMPSHAKRVHHYREPTPIFAKHSVERQLETIYTPSVNLKSGGYIVINQTEALVAIDVNSGRATRERGIEQTAFKTNCEAAEEAARQMRLRDLAGLIVIDFIDMEESKNDRAVEKKLKDALRFDRARVQVGKISGFGLMELSRQRRRTGVLEGTSNVCPHCAGAGRIRSVESSALRLLRALDDEAHRGRGELIEARAASDVSLYVLNEKRDALARIEDSRRVRIRVVAAEGLAPGEFELSSHGERPPEVEAELAREAQRRAELSAAAEAAESALDASLEAEDVEEADEIEDADAPAAAAAEPGQAGGEEAGRRRRRRRGRRGGGRERAPGETASIGEAAPPMEGEPVQAMAPPAEGQGEAQGERSGRRRRRRRGRGRRDDRAPLAAEAGAEAGAEEVGEDLDFVAAEEIGPEAAPGFAEPPVAPVFVEPPVEPMFARADDDESVIEAVVAAEPAAAEAFAEAAVAPAADYAPDQERRDRFFARLSRWGKKEAG